MTPLITQVTSEADTGARAIKELSAAVSVSRSSYYRHRQQKTTSAQCPLRNSDGARRFKRSLWRCPTTVIVQ